MWFGYGYGFTFINYLPLSTVSLFAKSAFWLRKVISLFDMVLKTGMHILSRFLQNHNFSQWCLQWKCIYGRTLIELIQFTSVFSFEIEWNLVLLVDVSPSIQHTTLLTLCLHSFFPFLFMTCKLFFLVNVSNWILSNFSSFDRGVGWY